MDAKPKNKLVEIEEKVLNFWNTEKIFQKSLEKEAPKGEFVFYDGPPFWRWRRCHAPFRCKQNIERDGLPFRRQFKVSLQTVAFFLDLARQVLFLFRLRVRRVDRAFR